MTQEEDLIGEVARLKLENSIFQQYIDKKTAELGIEEENKKKKKKRNTASLLTSEQKYDISNIVYEDVQVNSFVYELLHEF